MVVQESKQRKRRYRRGSYRTSGQRKSISSPVNHFTSVANSNADEMTEDRRVTRSGKPFTAMSGVENSDLAHQMMGGRELTSELTPDDTGTRVQAPFHLSDNNTMTGPVFSPREDTSIIICEDSLNHSSFVDSQLVAQSGSIDSQNPLPQHTGDFSEDEKEVFLRHSDLESANKDVLNTSGAQCSQQTDSVVKGDLRFDGPRSPQGYGASQTTPYIQFSRGTFNTSSPQSGEKRKDLKYDYIVSTLADMSGKLKKLDTLESITLALQEEVSKGNLRMEEISASVCTVKTELSDYVKKWEDQIEGISASVKTVKSEMANWEKRWDDLSSSLTARLTKLEKNTNSWEKKSELNRQDWDKDIEMIQSGVDSNSKKVIEFETFLLKSKQKWEYLHKLEKTIKKAADKKFQELKGSIKNELITELKQELTRDEQTAKPVFPSEEWKATIIDLKKQIMDELQLTATSSDDWKTSIVDLKKQILDEVKSTKPEVTPEAMRTIKNELLVEIQSQNKEVLLDVQSKNKELLNRIGNQDSPSSPESIRHNFFKEQAFARRLKILVFGITDLNSPENDLKEIDTFFQNQMGLHNLLIQETYRLGSYTQTAQTVGCQVFTYSRQVDGLE